MVCFLAVIVRSEDENGVRSNMDHLWNVLQRLAPSLGAVQGVYSALDQYSWIQKGGYALRFNRVRASQPLDQRNNSLRNSSACDALSSHIHVLSYSRRFAFR